MVAKNYRIKGKRYVVCGNTIFSVKGTHSDPDDLKIREPYLYDNHIVKFTEVIDHSSKLLEYNYPYDNKETDTVERKEFEGAELLERIPSEEDNVCPECGNIAGVGKKTICQECGYVGKNIYE